MAPPTVTGALGRGDAQRRGRPGQRPGPLQLLRHKAALGQLLLHVADELAGRLHQPGEPVLLPAGEQLQAAQVLPGVALHQGGHPLLQLLGRPLGPLLGGLPEDFLKEVVHQRAVLQHVHLGVAALLH